MKQLRLEKMSQAEFLRFLEMAKEFYADDQMRSKGSSPEEAMKIALDALEKFLPNGLDTPDHYLSMVKDVAGENQGYLWYGIRTDHGVRKAFVYDIFIEEKYRGQGLGRQTMLMLEEEVRKHGLSHIGLHAFGFNKVAIGLYKSLGFETTDLMMEKKLNPA